MKSLHTCGRERYQRLIVQGLSSLRSSYRWTCSIQTLLICPAFSGLSQAAVNPQPLPDSSSTTPVSCLVPGAGAPSWGIENSPGSTPATAQVPYHVGNPINVISANKYQHELDYKSFSSGLTLARHYNSSLSIYDIGFGPGWRHTYQVLLTRVSQDQLTIVQSDGRRVVFQGSHLVMLDLGNHLGVLSLRYRAEKLRSVTDSSGDMITFQYVPGDSPLPDYGSVDAVQPAGSIASVSHPGGQIIRYQYGT